MITTNAIANAVSLISLVFAVILGIGLIVLLIRRRRFEAKGGTIQEEQTVIFRHLAGMLAGNTAEASFSPGAELRALNHMATLVRGDDREKLLAYAENKGLFDETIEALSSRHPERRIDAIHRLERFACETCIAALDKTLRQDTDPKVRLEAAMALARADHLPPPEKLISALKLERKKPNRVHMALFRSLATKYEDELVRLASDINYISLRPLLIESLGYTNNLGIVSRLAVYARDSNLEARTAAIKAARHLGHPGAAAWILPLLDDPAQPVRLQAVQACGELRIKAGIPRIEELLGDPDWWIRSRARTALELLAPKKIKQEQTA